MDIRTERHVSWNMILEMQYETTYFANYFFNPCSRSSTHGHLLGVQYLMVTAELTALATEIISKMRLFKNYTYICSRETSHVEWAVVMSSQNSNFIGDWVNIFNKNQRRICAAATAALRARRAAARKLEAMCDTKPDKTTKNYRLRFLVQTQFP